MIYKLDTQKSKIEFTATAPFHKFKGWAEKGLDGYIDIDFENNIINDINVIIKTEYFETGDKLKDKEMQKYIKSNIMPDSYFKLTEFRKITKTDVYPDAESYDISVTGILSFMDTERKLDLQIKASKADNRLYADVSFDWSFKNYALKPPHILFIKVKDTVKISAYLEFIEE